MKTMSKRYIHSYNDYDQDKIEYKPVDSFKDFDFKGYNVKKKKKADSLLKKAWRKFTKATSSDDFKLVAGMLLVVATLYGDRDMMSALRDMSYGRMDAGTIGDIKDFFSSVFDKYK